MTLNNRKLVLVAVRLKSSRLEKKALADLAGQSLIMRLFERLNQYISRENIVFCTSTHPQDDDLCHLAKDNSIQFFRGSELDVAQRFIETADIYGADTIVRVTGDNPLTDSKFILKMLKSHSKAGAEYTYVSDLPVGTRSEVIDVAALKRIRSEWTDPKSSEYMTYMLIRDDKIRQNKMCVDSKILCRPELRLTVDTAEDLVLMRSIYEHFNGMPPKLEDIIKYLDLRPDICLIEDPSNSGILPDEIDCSYIDD